MGRIVVGADGSEGGHAALRWAIAEAKLRGLSLEVVHAWQPMSPTWAGLGAMGAAAEPPVGADELREFAQSVLDASLAAHRDELDDLDVEARLSEGHPASVLVEASRHADLLVVGSRGLGGVRGMLMGSVSRHVVHHAHCPVVVIPHGAERSVH